MAVAALVTTVALAAPRGWPAASAELVSGAAGHVAPATGQVTLSEVVRFDEPRHDDEFVLAASLHLLDAGGGDGGVLTQGGRPVEVTGRVRPREGGRELRLPLPLDARDLAGKTVVCEATLSKGGDAIARWRDVADGAQAMRFPKLVAAFEGGGEGGEVLCEGVPRIHARGRFENVEPGTEYVLAATLVDADTGESLVDGSGGEIRTSHVVRADARDGEVDLSFELAGAPVAGKRIGLRATLSLGPTVLATHEVTGVGALSVPKISSSARVSSVGPGAGGDPGMTRVEETVAYEGLVPGIAYVLRGAVRDGETGAVLLDGGKPVGGAEAKAEVTPTEPDGSVTLAYDMDVDALAGRVVATCDVMTRGDDGRVVAEYDGVASGNAVRLASASAAAVGAHTGMPCEPAWENAGVRSVVSYRNLEPGREYVVEGTLRLSSEKGAREETVADAEGNPASARVAFTPTETDGTVELSYDLDATAFAGRGVVADEEIVLDGARVARVRGAGAVGITSLRVSMEDAESHLRETMAREATPLSVRIDYGDVPESAEVACTLLDTQTGRALLDASGSEARAGARAGSGGTTELTLSADTRNLAGHGVAAYATVSAGGTVIATAGGVLDAAAVVRVPKATATLASASDGLRVASESSELVSSVSFDGLDAGVDHVVRVALVDAADGKPVRGADGRDVAGVAPVSAGRVTGSADVSIPLGIEGVAGRTLAAVASVRQGDVVTAQSSNASDETCRVRIPKVEVRSASADFGDGELPLSERVGASARVDCTNLAPGLAYVVSCALVDTGEGDGRAVATGEARLETEGSDGTVEVPLALDTRGLAGRDVDVHATLSLGGAELAGFGGGEARLHVPAVTTSLGARDGSKVVDARAGAALVDVVSYANLTPGVEYELEGEIVDAATGRPAVASVKQEVGRGSSSQAAATPGPGAGEPAEGKADSTTVWVADDGRWHLDKACASAHGTLRRTTLGIARSAGKPGCPEESGKAGGGDAATAAAAGAGASATREEERPCKASVRFTPEEGSGSVEVEFDVDAGGLEGRRLAAMETLRRGGRVVAEHRDTSDAAQSVEVSGLGVSGGDEAEAMGQTGTGILPFVGVGMAAALVVAGIVALRGACDGDGDGDERE